MSTTGASVQLIRNATTLLDVGDTTFLVDPMFTPQGEMPTVTDFPGVPEFLTTTNQKRIRSSRYLPSTSRTTP